MCSVAILIPVYQSGFSADEEISLRQLRRHLDSFHKILLEPEGLGAQIEGFDVREYPAEYFRNTSSYSRLLLTPSFYETFSQFDYILIYQLDCLVFSNDLESWCQLGYDYIGSPLFEKDIQPPRFSRVGNGGLSLRRVQAFLDVLNSPHVPSWSEFLFSRLPDLSQYSSFGRWRKQFRVVRQARRGVTWYSGEYGLNEDLFWSDRARLFHPDFKIAPLDAALRFAFESNPRLCFERNGKKMPFGAHAWTKWDRAFWEPFLIS